ncbi:hypothetical protein [Streptomyces sp. NPDC048442]|uniref:hypothetical protein n=1 Tax=Streptomyces sp. NPDC048442 TaxID=3154823 RepID=UPI0034472A20
MVSSAGERLADVVAAAVEAAAEAGETGRYNADVADAVTAVVRKVAVRVAIDAEVRGFSSGWREAMDVASGREPGRPRLLRLSTPEGRAGAREADRAEGDEREYEVRGRADGASGDAWTERETSGGEADRGAGEGRGRGVDGTGRCPDREHGDKPARVAAPAASADASPDPVSLELKQHPDEDWPGRTGRDLSG